jgi:hypothetical protein
MKEEFEEKLTLILEDFDRNKTGDMKLFVKRIIDASEEYMKPIIVRERNTAVIEFLKNGLNKFEA